MTSEELLNCPAQKIITFLFLFHLLACSNEGFKSLSLSHNYSSTGPTSSQEGNDSNNNQNNPPNNSVDAFKTQGKGGGKGNVTGNCSNGSPFQLYVPNAYSDQKASPIVAAIYGLGDTASNFARNLEAASWYQTADANPFILLVPTANNSARESFLHLTSDGSLDGAATEKEVSDIINCIYYTVGTKYNIDTEQIHFIGMSEGAVFTGYAGITHGQEIKSVALYAGALGITNQMLARLLPVYFIIGTNDFSYTQIREIIPDWISAGHPVKEVYPAGVGHSFIQLNSNVASDEVWNWLKTTSANTSVKSSYIKPK